ncbi:ABC transporter ATP-binding protein [Breoghania sp. L-A4]|uniref:ABC transporter ATP-binding protein n=1 Tax=Breoghania sp. L-A4 TaxID=2304600 RepID=UPI000E35ED63|nr:ABC transporter ATP-binding protein [Breoghania sp. L-A4]AXS42161.1 ABC transporter ATP-binding protein [Breoghania sp. L-A4]
MEKALHLKGVSKAFGAVVVADSLDLELEAGEALGVIGPNGAGKTSMFNLITGTLKVDRGEILHFGRPIAHLPVAARCRQGIARSFQIPKPFGDMSVYENVLTAAAFGGPCGERAASGRALEVLELTGLAPKANARAGSLTLLERKRLELARALATDPKVLLLDEIAGGLTERECAALIAVIGDIRATGVSLIWIEHIVHALLAVVDRLVVINFGVKIAEGDPHEVIRSPQVAEIYMGIAADA